MVAIAARPLRINHRDGAVVLVGDVGARRAGRPRVPASQATSASDAATEPRTAPERATGIQVMESSSHRVPEGRSILKNA